MCVCVRVGLHGCSALCVYESCVCSVLCVGGVFLVCIWVVCGWCFVVQEVFCESFPVFSGIVSVLFVQGLHCCGHGVLCGCGCPCMTYTALCVHFTETYLCLDIKNIL